MDIIVYYKILKNKSKRILIYFDVLKYYIYIIFVYCFEMDENNQI